ncbi:MAG: hypothetical protein DRP02_02805 [Candidatus Gerdarchaeota archaeon]|nr:MAG: hypothetical protein DRO63_07510 [Candidatus Gerdarchaeota archaeon]RLI72088.1 MAG: hypothetical protein DRP02_02805 [Candidatus Gerdarchaeota archaeon]
MSYSSKNKSQLELEAELFSCIATIDNLSHSFADGILDPGMYRRQLRALIRDAFKARFLLQKKGFNLDGFLEREQIIRKYPYGAEKLRFAEGVAPVSEGSSEETIAMPFAEMRNLPAKTADFVATAIELIDLLRLGSVARVELIVPNLEEMIDILSKFPGYGKDSEVIKELENWKEMLEVKPPDEVLEEGLAKRLEFEAVRWLNGFRRSLRNQ